MSRGERTYQLDYTYKTHSLSSDLNILYPASKSEDGITQDCRNYKVRLETPETVVTVGEDASALLCCLLGLETPRMIRTKNLTKPNLVRYDDFNIYLNLATQKEIEQHGACHNRLTRLSHDLNKKLKEALGTKEQFIFCIKNEGYYLDLTCFSGEKDLNNTSEILKTDYSAPQKTAPYILPSYYICPSGASNSDHISNAYQHLMVNAFQKTENFIHVLFGRRGLGKTLLAEYFANQCCTSQNLRPELRFQTILRTYYSQNLTETIATLPLNETSCSDGQNARSQYVQKLELLRKCPKPALLILDNFDSGLNTLDNSSSREFLDLRSTGCQVLITSRQSIPGNVLHMTRITEFPIDQLLKLFYQMANWAPLSEEQDHQRMNDTKKLITEYLQSNTILTVIAGKLCQAQSPRTLINAFQELKAIKNDEPVTGVLKDETTYDDKTLLELCQVLFDFSKLKNDHNCCRFLANLAMLPLEGMEYNSFIRQAFLPDKSRQMRSCRQKLEQQAWIKYVANTRQISLHPLVREMVVEKLADSCRNDTKLYLKNLVKNLRVDVYHSEVDLQLIQSCAADLVCDRVGLQSDDTVFLEIGIAALYNTRNTKTTFDLSQKYGQKALPKLEKLLSKLPEGQAILSMHTDNILKQFEQFDPASAHYCGFKDQRDLAKKIAYSWNILGYTFSRPGVGSNDQLAKMSLLYSARLIMALLTEDPTDDSVLMLQSKIFGNLAGLSLRKKDYWQALLFHEKSLEIRKGIYDRSHTIPLVSTPDSSSQDSSCTASLASAHKGIATAEFYLAQTEDAISHLQRSVEHHKAAYELYSNCLTALSPDLAEEATRYCGTVIALLNHNACPLTDQNKVNLMESVCEKQLHAAEILKHFPEYITAIKDCLKKLADLLTMKDTCSIYLQNQSEILNARQSLQAILCAAKKEID